MTFVISLHKSVYNVNILVSSEYVILRAAIPVKLKIALFLVKEDKK